MKTRNTTTSKKERQPEVIQLARQRAAKALREFRRTKDSNWLREYHSCSQWIKKIQVRPILNNNHMGR